MECTWLLGVDLWYCRDQSALDGLVYAIKCLANGDVGWCELLLTQEAPQLLFRLLDPEAFNPEVQIQAAGALLPLLERAHSEGSDVAALCKPSDSKLVKLLIGDYLKQSDKKVCRLLRLLAPLV